MPRTVGQWTIHKSRAFRTHRDPVTGVWTATDRLTGDTGTHPRLPRALDYAHTRATTTESERDARSRLL